MNAERRFSSEVAPITGDGKELESWGHILAEGIVADMREGQSELPLDDDVEDRYYFSPQSARGDEIDRSLHPLGGIEWQTPEWVISAWSDAAAKRIK
jgi:hypothetical protein